MPPKSKTKTMFVCQQCGSEQPKWTGRCPDCGEWNTFVETLVSAPTPSQAAALRHATDGTGNRPTPISQVQNDNFGRIQVPGDEFNRVLGGGIVPGSLVLIGGDPGIGKSTLLIQAARALATAAPPVLYVSAEESAAQVKLRADRLGITSDGLLLWTETDLGAVEAELDT